MLSHRKKPTRNSMATMGMLSGFLTMSRKSGSSMDTPTNRAPRMNPTAATRGCQTARRLIAKKKRMAASVMKMGGSVRKLMASLRALTMAMGEGLASLEWPGDPAVLADAPEVHRHQDPGHERDADAVQDVEAQERSLAHEASAQQREARIGAGVDHLHAAQGQELRAGALVAEQRRGAGHVRADGDGPDGELVPGQQVAREREQQREHQQDHAHVPVELAGRLVRAGHEHPEHVQPHRDHHGVGAPAMDLTHDPQRHLLR